MCLQQNQICGKSYLSSYTDGCFLTEVSTPYQGKNFFKIFGTTPQIQLKYTYSTRCRFQTHFISFLPVFTTQMMLCNVILVMISRKSVLIPGIMISFPNRLVHHVVSCAMLVSAYIQLSLNCVYLKHEKYQSQYSSLPNNRGLLNKSVEWYKFFCLLHKNARFWPILANFQFKINSRGATIIWE